MQGGHLLRDLLSRKSEVMGSVISMWDDSSLYTSPCSRSGRKFKIFWSTISDWWKRKQGTTVNLLQGLAERVNSSRNSIYILDYGTWFLILMGFKLQFTDDAKLYLMCSWKFLMEPIYSWENEG